MMGGTAVTFGGHYSHKPWAQQSQRWALHSQKWGHYTHVSWALHSRLLNFFTLQLIVKTWFSWRTPTPLIFFNLFLILKEGRTTHHLP